MNSSVTTSDTACPNHQRRRFAIVTPRFWPFVGPTELAVCDLATAIKAIGHDVDILTGRWEKNWPANFQFQELPIHRINRHSQTPWKSFRYVRNLNRKLTELAPDGIIVFGLQEEASAICKSFAGKTPISIRIDSQFWHWSSDKRTFTHRQISTLRAATSVIADSDLTANRITNQLSKTDTGQIHLRVVPDGIAIIPDFQRSPVRCGSSRVAISDAHPVLMVDSTQPLVICGAPLNGDPGVFDLIDAWPIVLNRFEQAKLWLLGDGPAGRQVWDRITNFDLVESVIMPGSFDELNDVFLAGDVYVHPLRGDQSCSILTRAMAAGICPVVTSTQFTNSLVTRDANGICVANSHRQDLAQAIISALNDKDLRQRLGQAAIKTAVSAYDIGKLVGQFLAPLIQPVPPEPQSLQIQSPSQP